MTAPAAKRPRLHFASAEEARRHIRESAKDRKTSFVDPEQIYAYYKAGFMESVAAAILYIISSVVFSYRCGNPFFTSMRKIAERFDLAVCRDGVVDTSALAHALKRSKIIKRRGKNGTGRREWVVLGINSSEADGFAVAEKRNGDSPLDRKIDLMQCSENRTELTPGQVEVDKTSSPTGHGVMHDLTFTTSAHKEKGIEEKRKKNSKEGSHEEFKSPQRTESASGSPSSPLKAAATTDRNTEQNTCFSEDTIQEPASCRESDNTPTPHVAFAPLPRLESARPDALVQWFSREYERRICEPYPPDPKNRKVACAILGSLPFVLRLPVVVQAWVHWFFTRHLDEVPPGRIYLSHLSSTLETFIGQCRNPLMKEVNKHIQIPCLDRLVSVPIPPRRTPQSIQDYEGNLVLAAGMRPIDEDRSIEYPVREQIAQRPDGYAHVFNAVVSASLAGAKGLSLRDIAAFKPTYTDAKSIPDNRISDLVIQPILQSGGEDIVCQ